MGIVGLTLTPATTLVLFLLIPLSSAFCIHAMAYHLRDPSGSNLATQGFAVAAFTTIVGFASTGFTDAGDVRNMALMGVVGILAAAIGVLLFVVPGLARVSAKGLATKLIYPIRLLSKPAYGVIFLTLALIFLLTGLPRLQINYEPTSYLPDSHPARIDFERVGMQFGKLAVPAVFKVESVYDPGAWREIQESLEAILQNHDARALWFFDYLSEFSKAFTLSDRGYEHFPASEQALYQYLQFVEPDDLELFVNLDDHEILVLFQVKYEGSRQYKIFEKDLRASVDSLEGVEVSFPGRVSAFFHAGHKVGTDTLIGLLVCAFVVFAYLYLLLKSAAIAAAGVLTNVVPVALGLAVLGHIGADIDLGSAIVAAIAFGIVLDDSAHLMFRVRELVRAGFDPATAVSRSVSDLFMPIVTTTVVVVAGFSLLFLSDIRTFTDFGFVISITLVGALVSDLVLLPFVIRYLYRDPLGS